MRDLTPLFDALTHAMDQGPWTQRQARQGVVVSSGHPTFRAQGTPYPCEGFLVTAERTDISVDHGLAYFHDACHFADTANAMTTRSQIVRVDDPRIAQYRAIVRTGFALPWPLQDREFLHLVATRRDRDAQGRDRALIAYDDVPPDGLPPAWEGYLRCPMAPSGQRITVLGGGRVRLEHCMTYRLGGAVRPWVQDRVFHRGHIGAYRDEWIRAMDTLAKETAAGAPRAVGRPAA